MPIGFQFKKEEEKERWWDREIGSYRESGWEIKRQGPIERAVEMGTLTARQSPPFRQMENIRVTPLSPYWKFHNVICHKTFYPWPSWGCFQREMCGIGPYRADSNLTLSHSRLWSPDFHPNDDEFQRLFRLLFKNGTTNRKKGEYEEGRGEGLGAELMS